MRLNEWLSERSRIARDRFAAIANSWDSLQLNLNPTNFTVCCRPAAVDFEPSQRQTKVCRTSEGNCPARLRRFPRRQTLPGRLLFFQSQGPVSLHQRVNVASAFVDDRGFAVAQVAFDG